MYSMMVYKGGGGYCRETADLILSLGTWCRWASCSGAKIPNAHWI